MDGDLGQGLGRSSPYQAPDPAQPMERPGQPPGTPLCWSLYSVARDHLSVSALTVQYELLVTVKILAYINSSQMH